MNADQQTTADVARLRHRRQRRTVAQTFTVVAALATLALGSFVAWDMWGTGISTARAQQQLLAQLQAGIHTPTTGPAGTVMVAEPSAFELPDRPTQTSNVDVGRTAPAGSAWALLRIDDEQGRTRIGPYAVIEGVADTHLSQGPGHYPSTPQPGHAGNVGVAGHRVTYGAPFNTVDRIGDGWTVVLIGPDGVEHRYQWHSTRIVSPDQTDVLGPDPTGTGRPTVTLTTCHPKHSDRQRMVVHALLAG